MNNKLVQTVLLVTALILMAACEKWDLDTVEFDNGPTTNSEDYSGSCGSTPGQLTVTFPLTFDLNHVVRFHIENQLSGEIIEFGSPDVNVNAEGVYSLSRALAPGCQPYLHWASLDTLGIGEEERYIYSDTCTVAPDSEAGWQQLTDLPTGGLANAISGSVYSENHGYILTVGTGREETLSGELVYTNRMWSYNVAEDNWQTLPNFPGQARESGIAASTGLDVIVGMGVTATNFHNDFYRLSYSPQNDQWDWTSIDSYPGSGVSNPVAFTLNGRIYVGLGYDGEANSIRFRSWNGVAWLVEPDFPGPGRSAAFAFVLDGSAYVGGGALGEQDFYSFSEEYGWETLGALPFSNTAGLSPIVIEGKAYVLNGFSPNNTVWVYDSASDSWTQDSSPYSTRYSSTAASVGCSGLVIGGLNTNVLFQDTWMFTP